MVSREGGAGGESAFFGSASSGSGSDGDPLGELTLGAQIVAVDVQPTLDNSSFHLHGLCGGSREEAVGTCRIDPYQEAALATRRNRYPASYQEGEPSEHHLFVHCRVVRQQLPDTGG